MNRNIVFFKQFSCLWELEHNMYQSQAELRDFVLVEGGEISWDQWYS